MFELSIPPKELYDENANEFIYLPEQRLILEHSLVSLSKWESKWNIPFLNKDSKTLEQSLDYIKCMTLNHEEISPFAYSFISNDQFVQINKYIETPMTATSFNDALLKGSINRDVITAEIIYYWMTALNIPLECEKWHLNRLLTFIKVCNIKNQPAKKMNKAQVSSMYKKLNEERKRKLNTKG